MNYKQCITAAMTTLGRRKSTVFVGYNIATANRAGGTLSGVPERKLLEMPLAENIMAGVATGLSLTGHIPVVYFERFDFVLLALDAIVNHHDKICQLSGGQYRPAAIFRVVVGNRTKPLFTGPTHVQDFTYAVRRMVSFPVIPFHFKGQIKHCYRYAYERLVRKRESTMLVEYKDFYDL